MMEVRTPTEADWQQFGSLAAAEGWRVPEREQGLFRTAWNDAAGVLIGEGRFCGLVTAVSHGRSGWIGNLVVPAGLRGKGCGGRLFRWAMDRLRAAGVGSIWLTASELGRPIYEKAGFRSVDRIERWLRQPALVSPGVQQAAADGAGKLAALDEQAWGEQRSALYQFLSIAGPAAACNDTAALLQTGRDLQLLGPWYSADLCPRSNRVVLQQLLAQADPAVEVVADLLASSPLRILAAAMQFEKTGEVELMAHGDISNVDLQSMAALASLGSFS